MATSSEGSNTLVELNNVDVMRLTQVAAERSEDATSVGRRSPSELQIQITCTGMFLPGAKRLIRHSKLLMIILEEAR